MKKSIVAMLSITALATVANAETLHTGTDFEGVTTNEFWATHTDTGSINGSAFYWYAEVDQSFGVFTNGAVGAENETKYLALDTEGNRVYRTIDSRGNATLAPSGRPVTTPIYFDSLVQFTVNEDRTRAVAKSGEVGGFKSFSTLEVRIHQVQGRLKLSNGVSVLL